MAHYNEATGNIQLLDPVTNKYVTINTPVENMTWNSTPVTWTNSTTKNLGSTSNDTSSSTSSSNIVTGASTTTNVNRTQNWWLQSQTITSTPRTQITDTTTTNTNKVVSTSEETNVSKTTSTAMTTKTALLPFMRERRIVFEANGLMPNSILRATFGDENVLEFCKQTSEKQNSNVTLQASPTGYIKGYFDLPNNRFKAGIRVFKLYDEKDPNLTYCSAKYTAAGRRVDTYITNSHHTETNIQRTIDEHTEVNIDIDRTETQLEPSVRTSNWQNNRWLDPVAQSFFVNTAETRRGVFLHSVDLYFWRVEPGHGVQVEIRLMRDGSPTNDFVYEYAKAYLPSNDIKESNNGTVPTRFTFETPIYLPPNEQYCFVARTTSQKTAIWCAEMGKKAYRPTDTTDPTGEIISKQPYMGSMFTSQNNMTWDAIQNKDVKFRLNRCKFVENGSIKFINNPFSGGSHPNIKRLKPDCIEMKSGSNIAKLYCHGHGFVPGDKFRLVFHSDFSSQGSAFGVSISDYLENVELLVTSAYATHVEFKMGKQATGSGSTGGHVIFIAGWVSQYAYAQLIKNDLQLDDTRIDYVLSGKSKNNYGAVPSGAYELVDSEIKKLNDTYVVKKSGDGGATVSSTLTSDATRLSSPMIYADSIGIETHVNIINAIDYQNPDNNEVQIDSSPAKYIQKEVTLINPANELKVFFESNLPFGTNVAVYYKVAEDTIEPTADWNRLPVAEGGIKTSSDPEEWRTQKFQLNLEGAAEFKAFQVMIVLMSHDTRTVPRVKNYRAIALYA